MRRSAKGHVKKKIDKDVKKSPSSTDNKEGRKNKVPVSEISLKKSSAEICTEFSLNDIELDYSDARYQEANSYKLFSALIRPLISKQNPKISLVKMTSLIGAKWHEFKTSMYFKENLNSIKIPNSLNLTDISASEHGSNIYTRKRKIQSPDETALEYEKKRLQNIAERMSFLESLNIQDAKENYVGITPRARGLKTANQERRKKDPKMKEILPQRSPSMRLRRLDPAGVPMPVTNIEPPQNILSYEELHPRKPSGILSLSEIAVNESTKETSEELLKNLTELTKIKDVDNLPQTLSVEFLKSILKLSLSPDHIAKVTRDRIFSIAINPCETKTVIIAGDKWGKIGIWDMDSSLGQDGVFCYEPHCRPVNCLSFAPGMPWKFYSCSYDGTVRLGDLECGVFDEAYANDEDDENLCSHFDFLSSSTLVVSQGDGTIVILDPRSNPNKVIKVHKLHKKTIRTVSVHPVQKDYILTASADSLVRLWDLRKISKNTTALAELKHNRTVTSAYFSPITGNKILSSSLDDKLRIFDSTKLDETIRESCAISHNNHAGRWLTKFRPVFHPIREDVFVVGSMKRPREIEIFFRGSHCHQLKSPNLSTVSSLNVFHPTKNILVGCNSSGRVMVFKEH